MNNSRKCNILLVEDNPGDIRLIEEALQDSRFDVQLSTVRNGEQALKFLAQEAPFTNFSPPDLILLDLNLPRLSGREVLAELKSNPLYRRIPIIVLTSSHAYEDIEMAYENHANCYIVKPTLLSDFFRVIDTLETFWLQEARLPTRERQ